MRASYQAAPLSTRSATAGSDANEPHHAIHQLDLMKNPVEHRPAVAEIAHVTPVPITAPPAFEVRDMTAESERLN